MDNQQVTLNKQDLLGVPEIGIYLIDLYGNIYSTTRTIEPKKLKLHLHKGRGKKPYLRVKLKDKCYLAHRIICSTHLGRQLTSSEVVNHLDGNMLNNQLSNLDVVSQHINVQHAVANNLYCSGSEWYKARETIKI